MIMKNYMHICKNTITSVSCVIVKVEGPKYGSYKLMKISKNKEKMLLHAKNQHISFSDGVCEVPLLGVP